MSPANARLGAMRAPGMLSTYRTQAHSLSGWIGSSVVRIMPVAWLSRLELEIGPSLMLGASGLGRDMLLADLPTHGCIQSLHGEMPSGVGFVKRTATVDPCAHPGEDG